MFPIQNDPVRWIQYWTRLFHPSIDSRSFPGGHFYELAFKAQFYDWNKKKRVSGTRKARLLSVSKRLAIFSLRRSPAYDEKTRLLIFYFCFTNLVASSQVKINKERPGRAEEPPVGVRGASWQPLLSSLPCPLTWSKDGGFPHNACLEMCLTSSNHFQIGIGHVLEPRHFELFTGEGGFRGLRMIQSGACGKLCFIPTKRESETPVADERKIWMARLCVLYRGSFANWNPFGGNLRKNYRRVKNEMLIWWLFLFDYF